MHSDDNLKKSYGFCVIKFRETNGQKQIIKKRKKYFQRAYLIQMVFTSTENISKLINSVVERGMNLLTLNFPLVSVVIYQKLMFQWFLYVQLTVIIHYESATNQ